MFMKALLVPKADALAEQFGLGHVVRREQHGLSRSRGVTNEAEGKTAGHDVQPRRRLVQDQRGRIVEQRRGDVFGEMGLIRHVERSADVVAVDPVEVFTVDERFLRRLQVRYPRTAAKVFLNLSRILSDRLQRMTDQYVATNHAT